ncbi:MAG: DSBA-like thioredoxin domain protein [Nocardioides sp.]|nr:DSBA-like thioredoxin domain protein [Nocardioides sp.]
MRIEIWSDVVCAWCYIGKRRLESALAGFEHADEVEIVWRSYQLDPSAPTTPTETVAEHLGRKYGGGADAGRQMIDRVEAVAAEEGLVYRLGEAQRVGTVDAHRVLHLAAREHLQQDLEEALFAAYFLAAQNVADHDVLVRLATEVGLDDVRVKEVLAGDEFADAVEADIRQATAYGATGVPFFVFDQRFGVSGAQPVEVFTRVLDQAWAASRPQLDLVGGADACGPDGCPV